ncbi:MAG: competence/damage-inducible protein A [Chloroflexota bacterium]
MRAAILSIGSELLRGDIVDSNAALLARELQNLGIEVRRVIQVGDDLSELTSVVEEALALADVVISTGGLGPTLDDLTREAIAATFGETMRQDDALVEDIRLRFNALQRHMPERNLRQAQVIPCSTPLPNPHGSAPGWYAEKDGKIVAALPGPPQEMQPMWIDQARPRLEALLPNTLASLALMTFGLGESTVEERIEDVIRQRSDVIIATYAKSTGVQVHISARAETKAAAKALLNEAEEQVRAILGNSIFGTGDDTLAVAVGSALRERELTLAIMESCTGGEVASMVTDVAGSSDYFRGGVVAYTPSVKAQFGVPQSEIDAHGVVSAETATAMALAACRQLQTSTGIGVTGIAGSDPVEDTPPGTCFVAASLHGKSVVREIHRPASRSVAKRFFAQCSLDLLRRLLLNEVEHA